MMLHICGFYYIIHSVIFMEYVLPKRKHPRLNSYDYSTPGAYFITVCVHNRRCLLSRIVDTGVASAEIQYSTYGQIAKEQLIDKLFQTSFYEHVIRGKNDYNEIAEYIVNNPKQWELDKLYSQE